MSHDQPKTLTNNVQSDNHANTNYSKTDDLNTNTTEIEENKQTDPVVIPGSAKQQPRLQETKKSNDDTTSPSTTLTDNNNVSALNKQSQPSKVVIDPKQLESKMNAQDDNTDDQDQNKRKIGRWYICEALGKGEYSWVKKGIDIKNGKRVALKFIDCKRRDDKFDDKTIEQIKTEITILKNIKHSNIVRLFAYNMKGKYPERDESKRDVIFLVMEYMPGGELFDLLYCTNALSEILARTYFRQLMAGVEALHRNYMTHRDWKPQNLLLDKHYTLKISDGGFSKIIMPDTDDDNYSVGTRGYNYQSPEILLHKPYTFGCDIFSCGVILFLLLAGYPPFQTATVDDRWYGNIARRKCKKFWKQHRGSGLSLYAVDLITKMLAFDPNKRITMDRIKSHGWYNDEIVTNGKDLEMIIQLKQRQMELKRFSDPIKQQILVAQERFRCGMWFDDEMEMMKKSMIPKPLPDDEIVGIFDVFTRHCAYEVLTHIQYFSKQQFGFEPTIDKNECSTIIRTAFQSDSVSAETSMCEILVCVYKYDEYECNLVKFVKLSGINLLWIRTFEQLMVWLRPVLDGVPHKIAREKFSIDREDERLLKRYFTSPRDTARERIEEEEPIPA